MFSSYTYVKVFILKHSVSLTELNGSCGAPYFLRDALLQTSSEVTDAACV